MLAMIELAPVQYYSKIYYWTMFAICTLTSFYYMDSQGCKKLLKNYSLYLPILLGLLLIVYMGLRPINWAFGDMVLYNHRWNIMGDSSLDSILDYNQEWFFDFIMIISKLFIPDAQFWFLIIAIFFIGCQYWACKKLLWENVWMAVLFVFFSYQFFPYGVNGLRNGMGCAIMMLAIAFFCDRNRVGFFIGIILSFLAIGCHRSIIIPIAAVLGALFVVKDIKKAIYIWIGSIILSLFAGGTVSTIFENLGFDNRMSEYSTMSENVMSQFSHLGFRWDFLLYSAVPVFLGWYVSYLGIKDKTFNLLINTYIFANSFWVLVCRAAFSNRFAYLSWFMYALVIAYVVIRIPIWKNQDKIAGRFLLGYSVFTLFMFSIGR